MTVTKTRSKRYRITVTRELTFETTYDVFATDEYDARDKAIELDSQNDLLAGKWTNTFRSASSR